MTADLLTLAPIALILVLMAVTIAGTWTLKRLDPECDRCGLPEDHCICALKLWRK